MIDIRLEKRCRHAYSLGGYHWITVFCYICYNFCEIVSRQISVFRTNIHTSNFVKILTFLNLRNPLKFSLMDEIYIETISGKRSAVVSTIGIRRGEVCATAYEEIKNLDKI